METLLLERASTMFTKCAVGQFECINGTSIKDGSSCIQKAERCDSVSHCSDNSDEQDCERLGCPGHFQCQDGVCLARQHVCDGIAHCHDGSDEQSCSEWRCNFDELSCNPATGNGPCLPALWKCDGLEQCANGFDESNCPDTCTNDEYFCAGQRKCIPEAWRCDGAIDCSDGEDERLCDCPLDSFKCHTGGCVVGAYVCDGHAQCPDGSDEWHCYQLERGDGALRVKRNSSEALAVCGDGWNGALADMVCAELGYAGASKILFTKVGSSNGSLVDSMYRVTEKNRLEFEPIHSMECNQGLQLYCEEYRCGRERIQPTLEQRIAGGVASDPNQWPSLALAFSNNAAVKCTASIVSPRWALASYTCIMGKTEFVNNRNVGDMSWKLFAGSALFNASLEDTAAAAADASYQIVDVKRVVPYPQSKYKQFMYTGDVALLELSAPLKLNDMVGSVCLAEAASIDSEQLCLTAGWGSDLENTATTEQYLKYLPVPTVPTERCNSSIHYNGVLPENAICAGFLNSNKTTCYNDEGAPLMCYLDGSSQWQLEGILSYHGNCGKRPHPAIYNSITSNISTWIRNTVGNDLMFERVTTSGTYRHEYYHYYHHHYYHRYFFYCFFCRQ
uniref:Scavenger receptor class A n=1 Tax=Anopheles melas TaxID=34690 RepID=A0A182UJ58_9DIPT